MLTKTKKNDLFLNVSAIMQSGFVTLISIFFFIDYCDNANANFTEWSFRQVCRCFFLKPLDSASILWTVKNNAAMQLKI